MKYNRSVSLSQETAVPKFTHVERIKMIRNMSRQTRSAPNDLRTLGQQSTICQIVHQSNENSTSLKSDRRISSNKEDHELKQWQQVARETAIFGLLCGFCCLTIPAAYLAFTENHRRHYRISFILSSCGIILFILMITLILIHFNKTFQNN